MAIALEVEALDGVPSFQQVWYVKDAATGKYRLDPAKVEIEDTTNLRKTLTETRNEAKALKAAQDKAIKDALAEALAPYEGIDPKKTRELMGQFEDAEESKLIAQGKAGIDAIINKRLDKARAEYEKQIKIANEKSASAQERATAFMGDVLDNKIRVVLEKAGLHVGAIDDALLHARSLFSLDDERNVVQHEKDGKSVVLGKDGKTPYSPVEWIESMRESKPHWFPAGGSGGDAHKNNRNNNNSIKTIRRSEYDALPHDQRRNWAKPGQIVE